MAETGLLERPLNVRLPNELASQLDALSQSTGRTKSFITNEALRNYLDVQSWQIADIHEAIAEADRGEFASEKDVKIFFKKYGC